MYPVHSDPSGSFQELARKNEIKFGQLSYLIIEPNCSRGNHYHKRKEEWFCCVHGKCKFILVNMRYMKTKSIILDGTKKQFLKIDPFERHLITNISHNEKCEFIVISSEEFNNNDPDTYKTDGQR